MRRIRNNKTPKPARKQLSRSFSEREHLNEMSEKNVLSVAVLPTGAPQCIHDDWLEQADAIIAVHRGQSDP